MAIKTAQEALEALALRFDRQAGESEELHNRWSSLDQDQANRLKGAADGFRDAATSAREAIELLTPAPVTTAPDLEYLAILLAGFKFPDRDWEDLTERSRSIARRSALTVAEALRLPGRTDT